MICVCQKLKILRKKLIGECDPVWRRKDVTRAPTPASSMAGLVVLQSLVAQWKSPLAMDRSFERAADVRLSKARATLSRFNIEPIYEISSFICKLCRCEISTRKDLFSQHMRRSHQAHSWTKAYDAVQELSVSFTKCNELEVKYREPTKHRKVLRPLCGLDVVQVRRCTDIKCEYMSHSIRGLREHMRKRHTKLGIQLATLQSIPEVHAQALRKRRCERAYFEVQIAQSDIYTPQSSQKSLSVENNLRKELYNYEFASSEKVSNNRDNREESPFVFVAKPHVMLQRYRLSMKQAAKLAAGVGDVQELGLSYGACADLIRAVRESLLDPAQMHQEGLMDVYEHIFIDYATPGETKKTHKFTFISCDEQGSKTLTRYVYNIVPLILMACRIRHAGSFNYPNIPFSKRLGQLIDTLMGFLRVHTPSG